VQRILHLRRQDADRGGGQYVRGEVLAGFPVRVAGQSRQAVGGAADGAARVIVDQARRREGRRGVAGEGRKSAADAGTPAPGP